MRTTWQGPCGWVAAVLCALAIAACGQSHTPGSVSATAYATTVCKALAPLVKEISTSSSALAPTPGATIAQRKTILERFLGTIAKDTDAAVAKLRSAGHPTIVDGTAIANQFVAGFSRLQRALDAAARTSKKLPTGPVAFTVAATALGRSVKNSVGGDVVTGLSALRTRSLELAAAKVPACHSITS